MHMKALTIEPIEIKFFELRDFSSVLKMSLMVYEGIMKPKVNI